ncbi:MBL fold metallo-hydrolase [Legionella impletisoli]|uniref:MBL fold hydrolase n=1 Tax=Legionella impletisoli TaxID=343510 RepID=A0A917N8I6_9GAMM|nr:MBL fold metallo-hydrolase [Legionella impletisoli]GGI77711.1 MBL fold hydrolase [Legionella impletisoli]
MFIQFLGATQTVTGSKYLIRAGGKKLLVDCGLFQGYKPLRLRNWQPLPISPASIDYVLLTHAHIDHSGYIPLLVKHGFKGRIYCTEATRDLCAILLPDSGHLHEEEARYANRKGYSKHHPAQPLYTLEEAEKSFEYFEPVLFEELITLAKNLTVSFHYAGHILGASLVRIQHFETSILFSGDLGRPNDPIMYPPNHPPKSNYYVVESTYGDRQHEKTDPLNELGKIINKTVKRGGTVLIPSFAVGRAQAVLYDIYRLKSSKTIPDVPVFIDSPMATDATKLFVKHAQLHRLSPEESEAVCRTAQYIHTPEKSMALNLNKMPKIIISASGMITGGRILHHVKNLAPDYKNSIVFCGYQAGGTRGDRILQGEKSVKMFGMMVSIQAEVFKLDNISAHADYVELLEWLSRIHEPPRKLFITHGEKQASVALKEKIAAKYAWNCVIPEYEEEVELI